MNPLWNDIAGGTLTHHQLGQLDAYLDALIEKNKQLNLTRITDRAEAEIKHVADALTLVPFIDARINGAKPRAAWTLADVGTGGGIPGVILAIARPTLAVTLIDSTRKKLDAVAGMCDAIGLANVRTQHARVEDVEETFDFVTARAVADVSTLLSWCGRLMRRSSLLLAMKGPRAAEEIAAVPPNLRRAWTIETAQASAPQLAGHVVLRIQKAVG
jgi:16S rRNA (guanine527-N7)-methyltransferase